MFEVTARDGAARLGKWEAITGRFLETPLVLYADTPRLPAPAHAEALLTESAERADGRPRVHPGGSLFYPATATEGAALVVQPALPYAPAGGATLLEAAQTMNESTLASGQALVLAAPRTAQRTTAGVVVLANARALFDNPYVFTAHATEARAKAGHDKLLYAPGVGLPHELALLVYAGIDAVDSTSVLLAARTGQYLTAEGPMNADSVRAPGTRPCLCDACKGEDTGYAWLRGHNLHALHQETLRVRAAVREGRLRELVESRARARPYLAAHLRRMDKEAYAFFEARAPTMRTGTLYATSKESLERPEVERFRRRLEERYRKPESARVLLILPCSARKPYSTSRTHRTFEDTLFGIPNRGSVHEVILTSPLGLVPREWENLYPAAHYDLPVTGHWDEDEKRMIRDTWARFLAQNQYDSVVCHLEGAERDIIASVLPEHVATCHDGNPLSSDSLGNLRKAAYEAAEKGEPVNFGRRLAEDMASRARWQWGVEGGNAVARGCHVRGKMPFVKLLTEEGEQVAMLTDRGVLSLTLEGGRRLLEAGAYRVEIENFKPKGTVFAVGIIGSDPEVREEDEVVLHHKGELKAVGRALMTAEEMVQLKRGGAVHVRHYAGQGGSK